MFRVGSGTNDAAIVVKVTCGDVVRDARCGRRVARGRVPFFAPRAAGAFVLRLLDAPPDAEPGAAQAPPKQGAHKASSNVYATFDEPRLLDRFFE